MIYTVSKLQREFESPFTTAGAIVREQIMLARQHHRRWCVPTWIAVAVAMVGTFVLSSPWAHSVFRLIWPVAMLCVGAMKLLAQRRAEAPIVAAAGAASATAAPTGLRHTIRFKPRDAGFASTFATDTRIER